LADRKPLPKLGMDFEDASIVRGVTEEEDHAVCAKVASLQECFSLDSLDVRHARLSFDEHESHGDVDGGISRAEITGNGHRDLGLESHLRTNSSAEALEERQLRLIAYRVATRVQRDCELQSQDWGDSGREVDGQRARVTTLCSGHPIRADTDPGRDVPNAEASGIPRLRELSRNALAEHLAPLRANRGEGLATGHADSIAPAAQPGLIRSCRALATLVEGPSRPLCGAGSETKSGRSMSPERDTWWPRRPRPMVK
jgi:hypothetical protein